MIDEPVRGGFPDPSFFSLPGIEQVRAVQRGFTPRPPIGHLLGIGSTHVEPGTVTCGTPASAWQIDSPAGTVQLLVLIETALHAAAVSSAPAGTRVETATMTTSYLRPATVESGAFVARARVVNTGRSSTLADAVVEDQRGRVLAQSMASLLIRPLATPPPLLERPLAPVPPPAYPTPDPYALPAPAWNLDPTTGLLDLMKGMHTGELPLFPALRFFGGRLVDVGEGRISVALPASPWFSLLHRIVAPGVVAWLGIAALNGASGTVAPAGLLPAVLNVNFTFLRPVVPDGRELLARGSVSHEADNLVVSAVEITDGDGNRVALGQETAVLRPFKRRVEPAERLLATVLFTDIVGSTEQAERLGDAEWHQILSHHHALVRSELNAFKGREVKTTGDGFLATFDSPGRAVQCARAIRDGVKRLGLDVRAGLHTGECDVSGADVAGIAVHIASRVQSLAGPGEILVSGTVRDLVAGSGLPFEDRGRHRLKGIEGEWPLFAVSS
ncbi:MAG TPA: hotdog fold thioesterase [Acidimicrobiia bacterium]|nr:hotdog fold thioesterase [Acidimicrobiia bacterium]